MFRPIAETATHQLDSVFCASRCTGIDVPLIAHSGRKHRRSAPSISCPSIPHTSIPHTSATPIIRCAADIGVTGKAALALPSPPARTFSWFDPRGALFSVPTAHSRGRRAQERSRPRGTLDLP